MTVRCCIDSHKSNKLAHGYFRSVPCRNDKDEFHSRKTFLHATGYISRLVLKFSALVSDQIAPVILKSASFILCF